MHRHVWEILKQEEQPSPFEIMHTAGHLPTKMPGDFAFFGFTRSVIVTRKCTKCGTEEVKRV